MTSVVSAIDIATVRDAARGRWHSILPSLTGLDPMLLDERNHPCPRCGGRDRFRCLDAESGALFCNQCFREKNGDGFAAIMWLHGVSFGVALREVAECLGLAESGGSRQSHGIPFDPRPSLPKAEKKAATIYPSMAAAIETLKYAMGRANMTVGGQWVYVGVGGDPLAAVLRFNRTDGTKDFRPVSKWPEGWVIKGPPEPRPLYHMNELGRTNTVVVTEGEKCCDAARSKLWPAAATTSMNGSSSPNKTNWTPLRGKRVIILPDNDEPGRKYAAAVATILSGLSCDVRIVELPCLPHGGDVADWSGTRGELKSLCGV